VLTQSYTCKDPVTTIIKNNSKLKAGVAKTNAVKCSKAINQYFIAFYSKAIKTNLSC